MSWKNQTPIKMYFDSSVPAQFYEPIRKAFETWEQAIGHRVFELAGTVSASQPAQDHRSVIYWEQVWVGSPAIEQANTTIYWMDKQITEADIRINAQYFVYSTNPVKPEVDLQSLIVHELGHVLGLAHNDSVPSVMAVKLPDATLRRDLYAADLSSVKCEY